MAFANKLGNLIKQSALTSPSLFQSIRSMSTAKLFVGSLSRSTNEQGLKEAFAPHGQVVEARVVLDRDTGNSRGFGFVSFKSNEEAEAALCAMDGKDVEGRMVKVEFATERTNRIGNNFSDASENIDLDDENSNFVKTLMEYKRRRNDDKFIIDATSASGDDGNSGEDDVLFSKELNLRVDGSEKNEDVDKST